MTSLGGKTPKLLTTLSLPSRVSELLYPKVYTTYGFEESFNFFWNFLEKGVDNPGVARYIE
jgi:hypothetical protein